MNLFGGGIVVCTKPSVLMNMVYVSDNFYRDICRIISNGLAATSMSEYESIYFLLNLRKLSENVEYNLCTSEFDSLVYLIYNLPTTKQ